MADRSMVAQTLAIGKEDTAGGGGVANRKVANMMIDLGTEMDFAEYRGTGQKYVNTTVPGDEWSSGDASGPLGFGEIVYPFASIINNATPTTDVNNASTWLFSSNPNGPDTVATYTVERGDGGSNFKYNYVYWNDLTLTANRREATHSGTVMGQQMTPGVTLSVSPYLATPSAPALATATSGGTVLAGTYLVKVTYVGASGESLASPSTSQVTTGSTSTITVTSPAASTGAVSYRVYMTAPGGTVFYLQNGAGTTLASPYVRTAPPVTNTVTAPVNVENVIVVPQKFDLFSGTSFANLAAGGTQLTRAFNWEFSLGNRFSPFFPMNSSLSSYAGMVEQAVDATLSLRVGMDTSGSDFVAPLTLTKMRAGTISYIRLQAIGPAIGGGIFYKLVVDTAVQINAPVTFEDNNGLILTGWDMRIVNDPTTNKPYEITVINQTPSL